MTDRPPGVQSWSADPAKNLPEPGRYDTPSIGIFNDGDEPTVALVLKRGAPDERVYRLSLADAQWAGLQLIVESERAKHVHPSARKATR